MAKQITRFVPVLWLVLAGGPALAATVWTGPPLSFTKVAFADPALPANQDLLTANVALTRGNVQGLYNALQEAGYLGAASPAGTQWAFAGLNGNPAIGVTATNFAALTFTGWAASLGGTQNLQTNIVGRAGVVHLIAEDIYLDIMFTSWGGGGVGGPFAYTRSTPDADTDGDGVPDAVDNCVNQPNNVATAGGPAQFDANGDGYGNRCDPDITNDGVVNINDLNKLKNRLTFVPFDTEADLTADAVININDINLLKSFLTYGHPGPSGLRPLCVAPAFICP